MTMFDLLFGVHDLIVISYIHFFTPPGSWGELAVNIATEVHHTTSFPMLVSRSLGKGTTR